MREQAQAINQIDGVDERYRGQYSNSTNVVGTQIYPISSNARGLPRPLLN